MPAVATNSDALRLYTGSDEIVSLRSAGTIPGVVVLAVAGRCGRGTGELQTTADGAGIRWRAPGDAAFGKAFYPQIVDDYLLEAGSGPHKWCRVHVTPQSLIPSAARRVLLDDRYGNGLHTTDVTANEASAGDVLIETLTVKNESSRDARRVRAWLDAATPDLELSADQIQWSAPTSELSGVALGDIAAGGDMDLYVRRTITAGETADPRRLNIIRLGWDTI